MIVSNENASQKYIEYIRYLQKIQYFLYTKYSQQPYISLSFVKLRCFSIFINNNESEQNGRNEFVCPRIFREFSRPFDRNGKTRGEK